MEILKVLGGYRVGILEKYCIKAGVELFNDYGYACDPQEALQLLELEQTARALKPKQVPDHMNNHNHRITLHMLQCALLQLWQHDDHQPLSIFACLGCFRHMQMLKVAGDHRVSIFTKQRIKVGVELFYDYGYARDQTPVWVLKPGYPIEGFVSQVHI